VRRPVHPDALRLLLLRTLYRGPEHRTDLRVTVGATVAICTLFRRRSAVLAEISGSGCRLLCNAEPKRNSRITLLLPPTLGGGRSFRLNGRVVRIKSRVSNLLGAQLELGVRFERLNGRVQQKLQNLIQERARGPALFDGPTRSVESAAPNKEQSASESGRERDRRANERRTYARRVIALGEEAAQVVVGQDLSAGGMRIEWRDDMNLGDTVELAVYGEAGSVPLILKAEVVRVEPETGVGLRFEKITPEVEQRLGEIVSELPVQSLDQAEDQGSVVTKILS
jgi:c-di-GMP-binding flagellar brake protein YcgR